MTDFTKRCDLEAKAYELLATHLRSDNWTSRKAAIANVFRAMWHASLEVERVNAIANAMGNTTGIDFQPELTQLVKAKVLRSRVQGGKRLYEVNY